MTSIHVRMNSQCYWGPTVHPIDPQAHAQISKGQSCLGARCDQRPGIHFREGRETSYLAPIEAGAILEAVSLPERRVEPSTETLVRIGT